MGLIQTITGLVFASLFAIAVIGYGVGFASDNNADVDISTDSDLSGLSSDLTSDVITYKSNANSSSTIFEESSIASGDENVEGGGQFKVTRTGVLSSAKNVAAFTNTKIFGGDTSFAIVTTAFISLLVMVLGLYAWKAWRGDPD